jgi:predicted DNA-binding transcriptional regulator AlpA
MTGSAQEPLLSPEDLSMETGVPIATLYQWRLKGTGPRSLKIGRHLRYRRSDVESWLESCASDGNRARA